MTRQGGNIRGRIDVDQPRFHPDHGPVWCLMVDTARKAVVWEVLGKGYGRIEGESTIGEWAGWTMVEGGR